jgi:queuine tRNA-ribosyltransferase
MTDEPSAPELDDGDALAFTKTHQERRARAGAVTTPHGSIQTPAFMPVGTQASVKGLTPRDLRETGSEIVLANTYHMYLSPGHETVEKLGGLHRMMGWDGPILTDSGGYQVFSLPDVEIDESGVTFQYEKSGEKVQMSPEFAIEIQEALGADIIMAFDVCVSADADYDEAQEAVDRTGRWLKRCAGSQTRDDQALFGIVQGSVFPDLRQRSVSQTLEVDLPGYAVGGLSVGEGHEKMMQMLEVTAPMLPEEKPRYLMGVGYPEDIIEAVARGIDMFDCVIPTRHARSGQVFTRRGKYRVTNRDYQVDKFPLDANCNCYACRNYSRAYIRHLIEADAILGSMLATLHNVTFYQDFMRTIRRSIREGVFQSFRFAFLDEYLDSQKKGDLGFHRLEDAYDLEDLPWETEHSCIPSTDIQRNLDKIGPQDNLDSTGDRISEIMKL